MKKIFILLLFMSTSVFANDPNFDTSTNIVTFPRVTLNNDTELFNVQILLNPDGTWVTLAAEPRDPVISHWDGRVVTNAIFIGCNAQFTTSLTLTGNTFTGPASMLGNCFGGESGAITGEVNGNDLSFQFVLNDNTTIFFSGTISSDYQTLSGSYAWPDKSDEGTWVLYLR